MIISEKQIMQLMTIVRTRCEDLLNSNDMMKQIHGQKIIQLLSDIIEQQSDELKVIE
jgi:hypothetical protein